jgi:hypothetical protein
MKKRLLASRETDEKEIHVSKRPKTMRLSDIPIVSSPPLTQAEIQSLVDDKQSKRQWANEVDYMLRYLHTLKEGGIPISITMRIRMSIARSVEKYKRGKSVGHALEQQYVGSISGTIQHISTKSLLVTIPNLETRPVVWNAICSRIRAPQEENETLVVCEYHATVDDFLSGQNCHFCTEYHVDEDDDRARNYFQFKTSSSDGINYIFNPFVDGQNLDRDSTYDEEDLSVDANRSWQVFRYQVPFHFNCRRPSDMPPPRVRVCETHRISCSLEHTQLRLEFDLFRMILQDLIVREGIFPCDLAALLADYFCFYGSTTSSSSSSRSSLSNLVLVASKKSLVRRRHFSINK